MVPVTVKYVDEGRKEIAKADVYDKVYNITELYTLGIHPKDIKGYKYKSCSVSNDTLNNSFARALKGQPVVYTYEKLPTHDVTEGQNSYWRKGSTSGLNFTTNGDFESIGEVSVKGITNTGYSHILAPKTEYTTVKGSIKLTLLPAYLEQLEPGQYSLNVTDKTGTATTTFTVLAKDAPEPNPTIDPNPTHPAQPGTTVTPAGGKTKADAAAK